MFSFRNSQKPSFWAGIIFTLSVPFCVILNSGLHAGEFVCPPEFSSTFFQTNGPSGYLRWGDWWASNEPDAGNQPHMFELYVPCTVDSDFVIEIQLYDPESYQTGSEIDEQAGASWDDASFSLMAPDGITEIAQQTFPPVSGTSEQWNAFASFTVRNYGCGIYRLYVSTSDDDQNSYKLKIVESDPDGVADSGDELNTAPVETSYQHNGGGCTTFWFYVPIKPELRLSNFDMDDAISVEYTDPDNNTITGTVSGGTVWNNGGGVPFPPPGGDVFSDPTSSWWHAELCVDDMNQYVFYAEGAVFIDYMPNTPDVVIDKDDGVIQAYEDTDNIYTIILTNNGSGPALNTTIIDTLPTGTSFVSATGNAAYSFDDPLEIITWDLGVLVPSESDTVYLTVHIAEGANSPIENWAHATHSDVFFNEYGGINDSDQDIIVATGSIGDYVWQDSNGDGIQDPTESGLQGVIVYLLDSNGVTVDVDTTNSSGNYLLENVIAGDYSIYVDESTLPQGAVLTTNNRPLEITLSEGENVDNADFGYDIDLIPVELTFFNAVSLPNKVVLEWRTQSETENLGFNILRSEVLNGKYQQVNPNLIAGAGTTEKTHSYLYEDSDVIGSTTYYYMLEDVDYSGNTSTHGPISAQVITAPKEYTLEQNYPNPFNPTTAIRFSLKADGHVNLSVYNMLGQLICTLVDENMKAGTYAVNWSGHDNLGNLVPSGLYVYTIEVNDFKSIRKMIFTK